MKQSNLDLLPVSELVSYLSAFKEGTEWNQMSEVTEALTRSLQQQGWAAPICTDSHRSFCSFTSSGRAAKGLFANSPVMLFWELWPLRGQWKGSQKSVQPASTNLILTVQIQTISALLAVETVYWMVLPKVVTRVKFPSMGWLTQMPQSHLWKSNPDEPYCSWPVIRT